MQMRVDEAGNDDLARDVDLARAAIVAMRSDDPVAADRDVALDQFAAREIEDAPALEHEIGLGEPAPLFDRAGEIGDGVAHGENPWGLMWSAEDSAAGAGLSCRRGRAPAIRGLPAAGSGRA